MRDSMRRIASWLKSVRGRRLRLGLLFGNVAMLLVGATLIAVLMWRNIREAERHAAESAASAAEYMVARNNADLTQRRAEDQIRVLEQALAASKGGQEQSG